MTGPPLDSAVSASLMLAPKLRKPFREAWQCARPLSTVYFRCVSPAIRRWRQNRPAAMLAETFRRSAHGTATVRRDAVRRRQAPTRLGAHAGASAERA